MVDRSPYPSPVTNQKVDWPLHPNFEDYLRRFMRSKVAVTSVALAGLVGILAATTDIPKKIITGSAHAIERFLDDPYRKTVQYLKQHSNPYSVTIEDIEKANPTDVNALRKQVEESRNVPEIPQLDPNIPQILGPSNPPK